MMIPSLPSPVSRRTTSDSCPIKGTPYPLRFIVRIPGHALSDAETCASLIVSRPLFSGLSQAPADCGVRQALRQASDSFYSACFMVSF